MTLRKTTLLISVAMAAFSAAPALAQSAADFQRPWGTTGQSQTTQPYRAGTRDANNNRVVTNGVMQTGVGVQAQMQGSGGVGASTTTSGPNSTSSASAIGNQLNVVVNGSWNTVIVNSTQTNNGTVTAVANSGNPGTPEVAEND
tara:strand:+ start:255 stop:686 length:432 start_codon:yes stop_codon:yes gene_type:complete